MFGATTPQVVTQLVVGMPGDLKVCRQNWTNKRIVVSVFISNCLVSDANIYGNLADYLDHDSNYYSHLGLLEACRLKADESALPPFPRFYLLMPFH